MHLPGKEEPGDQTNITLFSDPQSNVDAGVEDAAAQAVMDYVCRTWKFRVNDVNFKALNKLQRSYNEAKFFEEAFQDKAVVVTEAFAVAKKTQKEVNNQIMNICIAFSNILLTVTPTRPKKKNKFTLVFTGNSSKPTRVEPLLCSRSQKASKDGLTLNDKHLTIPPSNFQN